MENGHTITRHTGSEVGTWKWRATIVINICDLSTVAFLVQRVLSHGMAIGWEAMNRKWKDIAWSIGGLSAGASKEADQTDPNAD